MRVPSRWTRRTTNDRQFAACIQSARNLCSCILALIVDKETGLRIDRSDEIVNAALLTLNGTIVNPALAPASEPVVVPAASEPTG